MTNNQGWYLEYKKNPKATTRLFCFHHSGGGASTYYPWIEHLSPNIEMVAIQLPGREGRFTDPLNNNLEDIISTLSEKFHVYRDKPFFVFGHSLGAFLSFEFVKSIHQLYSIFPHHMIVSGTKAPHFPFRMKHLSYLDDKTLKEELKSYNGIDESLLSNDDLLNLFLPIIRNDFGIYENYSYTQSTPFPCDILALSGFQDQTVTQEEILGWSKYTTGKFEHVSFSGEHFFIKSHQKRILEIINQIADKYTQR